MAKRPDHSVPGILVIDKPSGMTSHDVVSRVRRLAHTRKVGHGGTLDPMATGVLVVGVGKATRLLTFITGHSKTYEATIRFGLTTSTDDAEGTLVQALGCASLSLAELEHAMEGLRGEIDQVPSSVSAKKIDGKRAYELVREGVEVELKANRVTVSRFERCSDLRRATLDTLSGPLELLDVDVVVDCSSGTYIRALARDLGSALGVGAHLTRLRRTRVGAFTLEDCRTLDSLEDEAANSRVPSHPKTPLPAPTSTGALKSASHSEAPLPAPGLIPLDEAVTTMFPIISLNEAEAARFLHGNPPKRGPKELHALMRAAPVHRAPVPPTPGAAASPAPEAALPSSLESAASPTPEAPAAPVPGASATSAPGVAVPPPEPAPEALASPTPEAPATSAPGVSASPSLEAPNPSSPRTSAKDALASTMPDHGAGLNARIRGETAPVLVDGDTTIFAAADPKGRILGLIDASKPRLKTICVFFGGEG
ncbi:tRNA pseudouridine(55) synthase TruB [Schaalia cardiffensis]